MTAKKILMLVSDRTEDYEIMVPSQALQMMDHQVHAVYPGKWVGQSVRTTIRDFEDGQTYSERPGHSFTLNADFAQARAKDYDALLIPGGCAPEYLRLNEQVLALMRAFDATRKPIAAVYHSAQLLAAAGVLQGRTCSTYPAYAPEVRLAGGEYVDISSGRTHIGNHLITAPAQPAHPAWLTRFLEMLGTRISH